MSSNVVEKSLDKLKAYRDDDFVDRCNYVYTAALFAIFSLVILTNQYFGSTIDCFFPAEYTTAWNKYSIDYCFIQNTYFVPNNQTEFPEPEERLGRENHYYQWYGFLLGIQMLFFVLPKLFLGSFNMNTGLSVQAIASPDNMDEEVIARRSNQFFRSLHMQRTALISKRNNQESKINTSLLRNPITQAYFLFKFMNTMNSIAQFILINQFIAPKTQSGIWGFDFLRSFTNSHAWKETGQFPRVSFCDIEVRDIGELPLKYTVQCVLMMNLLNEKIYVFLWFWLVFLCIMNVINFVLWLYQSQSTKKSIEFVKGKLEFNGFFDYTNRDVHDFIADCLFVDGVTALRLVEINTGEYAAATILSSVWKQYMKSQGRDIEEEPETPEKPANKTYLPGILYEHFAQTDSEKQTF